MSHKLTRYAVSHEFLCWFIHLRPSVSLEFGPHISDEKQVRVAFKSPNYRYICAQLLIYPFTTLKSLVSCASSVISSFRSYTTRVVLKLLSSASRLFSSLLKKQKYLLLTYPNFWTSRYLKNYFFYSKSGENHNSNLVGVGRCRKRVQPSKNPHIKTWERCTVNCGNHINTIELYLLSRDEFGCEYENTPHTVFSYLIYIFAYKI